MTSCLFDLRKCMTKDKFPTYLPPNWSMELVDSMAPPVQSRPCQVLPRIWTLESSLISQPLALQDQMATTEVEKWVRLAQELAMAAEDEVIAPNQLESVRSRAQSSSYSEHRCLLSNCWYNCFCKYPTFWNSKERDAPASSCLACNFGKQYIIIQTTGPNPKFYLYKI